MRRWAAPAVVIGLTCGTAAWTGWTEVLAAALGLALLVVCAPVPFRALLFRLRPFLFFAAVTLVLGGLGSGETLARIGPLHWGLESVHAAGVAAVRLFLLGAAFSWVSLRMGTARIVSVVWAAGRRLKSRGINLDPLLLAFAVAVRFLPLIQDEAVRLRLGWEARGGSLAAQGLLGRVKSAAGLVIPLLAAALRRAEDFANAVEIRSRGGAVPGVSGAGASSIAAPTDDEGDAGRRLVPGGAWRSLLCVVSAWSGVIVKVWQLIG